MKRKDIINKTTLQVENIKGFLIGRVTKFGSGAKVNCPKKYLGKTVYLIICKDDKEVKK